MGSTQPASEILRDLMLMRWQRYSSSQAWIKELHNLVKARCTILRDEAFSLSHCPEIAWELDSLSIALQHFRQTLDIQAKEHYKECTQLYYVYVTEYNEYVMDHYATATLSQDELLYKMRKARKSFLASCVSLSPQDRWPELLRAHMLYDISVEIETLVSNKSTWEEFIANSAWSVKAPVIPTDSTQSEYCQVVETWRAPHEVDIQAPLEPVQPEPITSSSLSVEDTVIPTDTQPEVLKTSLTPESKMSVRHTGPVSRESMPPLCPTVMPAIHSLKQPPIMPEASVVPPGIPLDGEPQLSSQKQYLIQGITIPFSPAEAGPLQLSLHTTVPIVTWEADTEAPISVKPQQQSSMHAEAHLSLIPDSLVQESSIDGHECTFELQMKPKEPDKAHRGFPGSAEAQARLATWLRRQMTHAKTTPVASKLLPARLTRALRSPCVPPSLSANPPPDMARQLSPNSIISKMSKTNALQGSPCPKAAPILPVTTPAHLLQMPSHFPLGKAVPQQWDTKNVVSKWNEMSPSRPSPSLKTAPMLSNMPPPNLLLPLWLLLLLEESETVPKREEKQLVSTAVSKTKQRSWDAHLLQHGTDSYIMHTWYIGQALLFSFNLLNLAMPL